MSQYGIEDTMHDDPIRPDETLRINTKKPVTMCECDSELCAGQHNVTNCPNQASKPLNGLAVCGVCFDTYLKGDL